MLAGVVSHALLKQIHILCFWYVPVLDVLSFAEVMKYTGVTAQAGYRPRR